MFAWVEKASVTRSIPPRCSGHPNPQRQTDSKHVELKQEVESTKWCATIRGKGRDRGSERMTSDVNVSASALCLPRSGLRSAHYPHTETFCFSPTQRLSWGRKRELCGEPPLAGVDLRPDHAHYLLLHLGLLRVDVGVSHLAVLVPAQPNAARQPTDHLIVKGGHQWGCSEVNTSLCKCFSLEGSSFRSDIFVAAWTPALGLNGRNCTQSTRAELSYI